MVFAIMFWFKVQYCVTIMSYDGLVTGFVTRRVSIVKRELLTLPEHLSSPPVFSGVRVTRSLVLHVCFVDRCLSFCTFFFWPLCCLFFFDIRILITPLVSPNSSVLCHCLTMALYMFR